MTHPVPQIRTSEFSAEIYNGNFAVFMALPREQRALAAADPSLHWTAACGGHIHMLQYFHDHDGDLAAGTCNALRGAARSGHVHVIDWLFQTIKITPAQRTDAIRLAGEYAHLDALKALYRHGATLDDIAKCARDTHSTAARDFLNAQKNILSADAVSAGCSDAVCETREDHQRKASRMKKALRLFGL